MVKMNQLFCGHSHRDNEILNYFLMLPNHLVAICTVLILTYCVFGINQY